MTEYKGDVNAMTELGEFIWRKLGEMEQTQAQMADAINVHPSMISALTRGNKQPPWELLVKIAGFLQLDTEERVDLFRVAFSNKEHVVVRRDVDPHMFDVLVRMYALGGQVGPKEWGQVDLPLVDEDTE